MKTTVEVFRSSAVQRTEQEVRWQAIGAIFSRPQRWSQWVRLREESDQSRHYEQGTAVY